MRQLTDYFDQFAHIKIPSRTMYELLIMLTVRNSNMAIENEFSCLKFMIIV